MTPVFFDPSSNLHGKGGKDELVPMVGTVAEDVRLLQLEMGQGVKAVRFRWRGYGDCGVECTITCDCVRSRVGAAR